ncbi:CPBP family intramembrane glutamic endopeptidase [Lentzea sp. HUAS12]|uniref:CPBP family intramembrane glutamic endopeptidase n=1 Tax=Lentzea sp. HUAS12 TaxID=2951806 RepID=UPI00209EA835|nr:CPBP family intramembrane glutamic endopeptidase [Lentzea sp. HUAS12]USX55057.1 CPBP family intramembrane metalloprotease [Lentzea sp. HUAS12]
MRFLKQLVVVVVVSFAGGTGVQALGWNWPLTLVAGFLAAALALAAYAWIVRRTEHREPTEVSLKTAPGALGRGVLVGLAMFGAVIVNIAFLGGYEVRGIGSVTGMIAIFGFMVAVAVTEELLYRGVLFRIVEEKIGTWLALMVSGLVFGFAHLPNPGATVWSSLAIAIEAGLMLGAAYVATRNLWVPIGVHFAWNFAQGGIFSTSVSGKDAPQGLLDGVTSGPAILTGGEFGPEASAYSVLAGVVVTAAFLWLAKRRGTLVPRRGRAASAATLDA